MFKHLLFSLALIGCGYGESDKESGEPAPKAENLEPAASVEPGVPAAEPVAEEQPAAENGTPEPDDEPTEEQAARKRYVDNALSTVQVGDSLQDILPEARELILNAECGAWRNWGDGLQLRTCVITLSESEEYNQATWYYWSIDITSAERIEAVYQTGLSVD